MSDAFLGAGDRVGRYELVRVIGIGGMGEVWEAVLHGPEGFRKAVALKVLKSGPAHPLARRALTAEARLGALLSHPNLVGTYELGEADGRWFVAMELVRGAAVADLIRGSRLSPAALVDLGVQTCAGLAHVHALEVDGRPAGLVHRDVKPANLLVDRSGLVKIADLGIARWQGGIDGAAGTPGYMAPEQFAGEDDERADLFGLGATLYLVATGRRAFRKGAPVATKIAQRLGEPGFLEAADAFLPGLAAVLGRCLAPDPGGRYATARDLADALRALRPPSGPSLLDALRIARADLDVPLGPSRPTTGSPASTAPTIVVPRGNVPRPRDAFFGRDAEHAELLEQVRGGVPVVTLLGPGGMGKTRLAIEAALAVQANLPGGAWFVALERATDERAVAVEVASALQVPPGDDDLVERVGYAIRGRGRVLLVLDNFEQAVARAAGVVERWSGLAPEATLLVTSRIALRARGERVLSLGPLSVAEGCDLFTARAARPPSEAERPVVEALVTKLEGVPLAVELAAARTRVLDPAGILARLEDRFRVLAGGGATLPERHRSLRASLDGSWELLGPAERAALSQLTVFVGGFTLEAAEAVVDPGPEAPWVLDLVSTLVDHSLVRSSAGRFGLLVSVALYAAEHLDDAARSAAERRHGGWFAQMGSLEALRASTDRGDLEASRRRTAETDNLVAAARRAVARGDLRVASGTALAAWLGLRMRGPLDEGVRLMTEVIDAGAPRRAELLRARARLLRASGRGSEAIRDLDVVLADPHTPREAARLHADALAEKGGILRELGRSAEARPLFEAALARQHELGDRRGEAVALTGLANLEREQGRPERACEHFDAALAIYRAEGMAQSEGAVLGLAATAYAELQRFDQARAAYEASIAMHRAVGDRRLEGVILGNLASLHLVLGEIEAAASCYRAALELHRQVGDRRYEGLALGNLGLACEHLGQLDEARACFEQALVLARAVGNRRSEGIVLGRLAARAEEAGRIAEARAGYLEAIAIHRGVGSPMWLAIELGRLGRLEVGQGNVALGIGYLEPAIATLEGVPGQDHWVVPFREALAQARTTR